MHIDSKTKIFGIIGYPLGHSFSPAMHNAAMQAIGYNGVYLPFAVKSVLNLKHTLNQLNISGLSVTIPYKIRIRRIVDKITPLALEIGSVNTIVKNKSGLFEGHNTDGLGAIEAIEESGFNLQSKRILIVGSGGSARAIAFSALQKNPQQIAILARNAKASTQLIRTLKLKKKKTEYELLFYSEEISTRRTKKIVKAQGKAKKRTNSKRISRSLLESPEQVEKFDLIINTTPIGMKNYLAGSPLEKDYLFKHQTLFDIVYNPHNTDLLKIAKTKQLNTIYGYKMLLYQGTKQFEMFTGEKAPIEVMDQALKKELKKNS